MPGRGVQHWTRAALVPDPTARAAAGPAFGLRGGLLRQALRARAAVVAVLTAHQTLLTGGGLWGIDGGWQGVQRGAASLVVPGLAAVGTCFEAAGLCAGTGESSLLVAKEPLHAQCNPPVMQVWCFQ